MYASGISWSAMAVKFSLLFGTFCMLASGLPQLKNNLRRSENFVNRLAVGDLKNNEELKPRGCSGCTNLKKNTKEYEMYLEYIKADILAKLGMKERPRKTVSSPQIPAPVYEGNLLGADEFDGSRSKLNNQIIIIGEKASKDICPEQDCFLFRLKKKAFMKASSVTSLQIWMYKLLESNDYRNNMLKVSVAKIIKNGIEVSADKDEKDMLTSLVHEGDSGWLGIDSAKANDWVSKLKPRSDDLDLYLSLKCSHCLIARKGDKRPFMVINIENDVKIRKRRSFECSPRMRECCRESLYVNFTEIGWNDWIVKPSGYDANYCRGTCHGLSVPIYGYVTVISKVKPGKKICCSPKSFSSLIILYFNENKLFKNTLEDMSVESCGCS